MALALRFSTAAVWDLGWWVSHHMSLVWCVVSGVIDQEGQLQSGSRLGCPNQHAARTRKPGT